MSLRRIHVLLCVVLFSISVANPSMTNICMMAVILINLFLIITKSSVELSALSTMIMGNEMYALLNAVICVVGLVFIKRVSFNRNQWKIDKKIALFAAIVIINSIINGILNNTLINVCFYVAYLVLLFICFNNFNGSLDNRYIVKNIKSLIWIELIATIIRVLQRRSVRPGDFFSGTFNNAHFFGNWLILTGIVLVIIYKMRSKNAFYEMEITKKSLAIYLIILIPMLYLADAKQIVLSFIIAVLLYFFIKLISVKKRNVLFWTFVGMYLTFYIIIWICSIEPVKNYIISKMPVYSSYIYKDGWNGRYSFAYGTLFESLANIRVFFGYGLGQYGSRVSNAFAYSVMWRADNFLNDFITGHFSPHFVPQFARLVSYFNASFVELIPYRSAILSYPFSSFIALLGETGIVGTVFFGYLINRYFVNANSNVKFLIIYYLSICIFDIYFDDFQCIIALIIYIGIFHGKPRKTTYNRISNQVNLFGISKK